MRGSVGTVLAVAAMMQASGPVRRKQTLEEYQAERADQIAAARERQLERNLARLAEEAEAQRRADAATTPAERERIERKAKKRAAAKAAKRQPKPPRKSRLDAAIDRRQAGLTGRQRR